MSVCMLLLYIVSFIANESIFAGIYWPKKTCSSRSWLIVMYFIGIVCYCFFCTIYQRNADENGISSSNNFVVFVMQMIAAEHPTQQEKYLFKHPLLRILRII